MAMFFFSPKLQRRLLQGEVLTTMQPSQRKTALDETKLQAKSGSFQLSRGPEGARFWPLERTCQDMNPK